MATLGTVSASQTVTVSSGPKGVLTRWSIMAEMRLKRPVGRQRSRMPKVVSSYSLAVTLLTAVVDASTTQIRTLAQVRILAPTDTLRLALDHTQVLILSQGLDRAFAFRGSITVKMRVACL